MGGYKSEDSKNKVISFLEYQLTMKTFLTFCMILCLLESAFGSQYSKQCDPYDANEGTVTTTIYIATNYQEEGTCNVDIFREVEYFPHIDYRIVPSDMNLKYDADDCDADWCGIAEDTELY